MKKVMFILVFILVSCNTEKEIPIVNENIVQEKEYETVKHIVLFDGREFTIRKLLNVDNSPADFSSSIPFGNHVITVYSDPLYSLVHNGVTYDEHAVPYLVDFDLDVIDLFEIDYEVEHIYSYENGNKCIEVIGSEDFLDFEVEKKLITTGGDVIVYEKLVLENFMCFLDIAIEIYEEVDTNILNDNGEVVGVRTVTTIRGLHDYNAMIKVTVNGVSAHGLGVFELPELTSERLERLGIGHNWRVEVEEIYY